jgi:hypothetical protein
MSYLFDSLLVCDEFPQALCGDDEKAVRGPQTSLGRVGFRDDMGKQIATPQ